MDQFTFNWTECTLTISISSLALLSMISHSTSCTALLFLLLQPLQKWLVLLHFMHLAICQAFPGWIEAVTVSTSLLCWVAWLCLSFWAFFTHCSRYLYFLNSFCSVILFIASAWALCASTLFTLVRTLPLVMWSLHPDTINSLIIPLTCIYHWTYG